MKTQGRRGEVAVEVHSDVPDRFRARMKFFALPRDSQERRELEVEELWPHKEFLILKFAGVDSISDAEELIGSELQVPGGERAALEAGWTFVSDLTGCAVFDHDCEIGLVADVAFGAGEAPLLSVRDASGKILEIPFAEAYLDQLDLEKKRLLMHLPEGLLEVNAPLTEEEKREQSRPRHKRH